MNKLLMGGLVKQAFAEPGAAPGFVQSLWNKILFAQQMAEIGRQIFAPPMSFSGGSLRPAQYQNLIMQDPMDLVGGVLGALSESSVLPKSFGHLGHSGHSGH